MITLTDVQAAARKYAHTRRRNPKDVVHGLVVNCQYTTADGRHCIAGQILSDLGVALPKHGSWDNTSSVHALPLDTKLRFHGDALDWLSEVQYLADEGYEWWAAISAGNKAVRGR